MFHSFIIFFKYFIIVLLLHYLLKNDRFLWYVIRSVCTKSFGKGGHLSHLWLCLNGFLSVFMVSLRLSYMFNNCVILHKQHLTSDQSKYNNINQHWVHDHTRLNYKSHSYILLLWLLQVCFDIFKQFKHCTAQKSYITK